MNTRKWVCHISGQGEKWEVEDECPYSWEIRKPFHGCAFAVPKSEYRLCEPPEEWEDVTEGCQWTNDGYGEFCLQAKNGDRLEAPSHTGPNGSYRVRKVQLWQPVLGGKCQWAFVVERRKS